MQSNKQHALKVWPWYEFYANNDEQFYVWTW